jgi:hypothetical protein
MYKRKEKHNGSQLTGSERLLGCWQVLGILAVTLLAFLLFYEPITNLLR